jgi:hypothetical protein
LAELQEILYQLAGQDCSNQYPLQPIWTVGYLKSLNLFQVEARLAEVAHRAKEEAVLKHFEVGLRRERG